MNSHRRPPVRRANSPVRATLGDSICSDQRSGNAPRRRQARVTICVNAVSLGVIKTPMHPVETHAQLGALHPVGRLGEISDIVDAILYLESASFVTGEILHFDGGQSAGH